MDNVEQAGALANQYFFEAFDGDRVEEAGRWRSILRVLSGDVPGRFGTVEPQAPNTDLLTLLADNLGKPELRGKEVAFFKSVSRGTERLVMYAVAAKTSKVYSQVLSKDEFDLHMQVIHEEFLSKRVTRQDVSQRTAAKAAEQGKPMPGHKACLLFRWLDDEGLVAMPKRGSPAFLPNDIKARALKAWALVPMLNG